jgi:hypothetical protein
MKFKEIAAGVATGGLLCFAVLGVGAGSAQADPPGCPGLGPGANFAGPGTPLPPGLGCLPPPGHGGPMPRDGQFYDAPPWWVLMPPPPPFWAPPPPPPPVWGLDMPVIWSPDLNVWGVFLGDRFIQL